MLHIAKNMDQVWSLLKSSHTIRIGVQLLDLDHNYLDDLSDRFVDGAVTVDATQDVWRSLDITLLDPHRSLHLDPDSPSKTAVYATNMIKVIYAIIDPKDTVQYNIPVFCGPITKVDRDSVFIKLQCLGKESLSLDNSWWGKTWKAHSKRTDVVRSILKNYMGETKLDIPSSNSRIPKDISINSKVSPWTVARKIARAMNYNLFYDGRGVAVMRPMGNRVVHTFTDDDISSLPQIGYDLSNVVNAARVTGAKPKKAKHNVSATYVAPRVHPLSPWRLGRGGVPRYLWVEAQDDSLGKTSDCMARAKQIVNNGLLEAVNVAFDGWPMPPLEENDTVRVNATGASHTFRLRQFTIPLNAADDSSFGYLRHMKPRGGSRAIKVRQAHRALRARRKRHG